MSLTTDPHDGCLHEIDPATGQQVCYLILPDGERKNLVRPVRRTYRHVGIRPKYDIRYLSDQIFIFSAAIVLMVLVYLLLYRTKLGKAMRAMSDNADLARVSGINTDRIVYWTWAVSGALVAVAGVMLGLQAQPDFYGGTFCATCREHFPVGEHGEFVWEDGTRVGT